MERHAFAGWTAPLRLSSATGSMAVCRRAEARRRVVTSAIEKQAGDAATLRDESRPYGAPGVISFRPLESNSWVLEVGTNRVFVDPWLVGTLQFGNAKFYEATKSFITKDSTVKDCGPIDVVVLSQGLPDHCHVPTLTELDKTTPIVCCPSAGDIARRLGFKRVTVLEHGQSMTLFGGTIEISAYPGSLVGPPWAERMNAYTFDCHAGADNPGMRANYKLFYEPHADVPPETLEEIGSVDGVLTPSVPAVLLAGSLNYPLVRGGDTAVDIIQALKARDAIVLQNNTTVGSGLLDKVVSMTGTQEEFELAVTQRLGKNVRVVTQELGRASTLAQSC